MTNGKLSSLCFKNTIKTDYLRQMARMIVGETIDYDLKPKIIELRDELDVFILRKLFNDKWVTSTESVFLANFQQNEGNGDIRTVKFFCGDDATTIEGTGHEVSTIDVNFEKTVNYNMNIFYYINFRNPQEV